MKIVYSLDDTKRAPLISPYIKIRDDVTFVSFHDIGHADAKVRHNIGGFPELPIRDFKISRSFHKKNQLVR